MIALLALAWVAVLVVACLAEAVMGDVEWPRRRIRHRTLKKYEMVRSSWADDPRSRGDR